jgi:hypothetical protein
LVVAVNALACELPAATGVPLARWHCPDLAREAAAQGMGASVSGSIWQWWLSADAVKPWRVGSWIFHRDPAPRPGRGRPASPKLKLRCWPLWHYCPRSPARSSRSSLIRPRHIVGLPDPAAACAFALDEPNYQAGVYRDVLLRRWRNLRGRTMSDFSGGRDGGNPPLGSWPRADGVRTAAI